MITIIGERPLIKKAVARAVEEAGYKANIIRNDLDLGSEDESKMFVIHLEGERAVSDKLSVWIERQRKEPILFLGFSPLEEMDLLRDGYIGYVRLPALVSDLSRAIERAVLAKRRQEEIHWGLMAENAFTKVRIFKHDLKNAQNTVQIVYKLKRSSSPSLAERNWNSIGRSIREAGDLIGKNLVFLNRIEGEIGAAIQEKDLEYLKGRLLSAEESYQKLLKKLGRGFSSKDVQNVISEAEITDRTLNEIVQMLENIRDESRK